MICSEEFLTQVKTYKNNFIKYSLDGIKFTEILSLIHIYADKTKQFTFTLTLGNAATETGTKQYEGTITRKDTSTEEITVTIGTPQEFTLGDGDSLYIENLPVGTICNITETGAEDYTPSLTYTLGNSDPQQTQGQVGTDFACGPFEMAEVSNTLDFTNTYKAVSYTHL